MDECITYIGLDVHKETIAVALAEGSGRGEVCGLCLESGGNSLAAFSEHVDFGLIRPLGQG